LPAVIDLPLPENPIPDDIAEAVKRELGAGGAAVRGLLALPAEWCLSASIDLNELPRNDRKAMLYRLEEKLPLSAETIVADFVESGERAIGVSVAVERVRALIDVFEERHIIIDSICPVALLAAQFDAQSADVLLVAEPDGLQVSILSLADGALHAWNSAPCSVKPIARQLSFLALNQLKGLNIRAIGLDKSVGDELAKQWQVETSQTTPIEAAVSQADRILGGESTPWIELRRGAVLSVNGPTLLDENNRGRLGNSGPILVLTCAPNWTRN